MLGHPVGWLAQGRWHVKYSRQLSASNNPGKEAEFSGSGAWGWGAAAARGPEVFTQLPFTLGSEGTTEREGCKKNLKYSKNYSVSKL